MPCSGPAAELQPKPSGKAQLRALARLVAASMGSSSSFDDPVAETIGKRLARQADRVRVQVVESAAAAEQERARLERIGEIDRIGDVLGVGADGAPIFDPLLRKTIEERWPWRYWTKEGGKKKQARACLPHHHPTITCPCSVHRLRLLAAPPLCTLLSPHPSPCEHM